MSSRKYDPKATDLAILLSQTNPGYTCRVLPDNSVACMFDLMFTRAIALGCNEYTWESRFCFDDRELAVRRFYELASKDDEPQGYIAKRGRASGCA